MRSVHTLLRIVVIVAGFAAMFYALYVRMSLPVFPFLSFPFLPAVVVAGLAGLALVVLILPWKPRQRAITGREVTGTGTSMPLTGSLLAFIAAALGFVAMTFLGYLQFAQSPSPVPGMDRIGPWLPYGVCAVMVLLWFGDSVFGRIVTGTATGKSPIGQRFLLIGKRLGAATLMTGLAILLHINFIRSLYPPPRSQMIVTLGFVLFFTVALIPRLPAFTPRADGSVSTLI